MYLCAIFGGTFNPFHIGHYEILKSLCNNPEIDRVLVIPDRIPPHKKFDKEISDSDRIEMCRIMCEKFDKAKLCLIEFERDGKSFTFDTVKELKNRFKKSEFAITIGADMLKILDKWHKFDSLKNLASFIVFNRDNDKEFNNDVERIRNMGAEIKVINDIIPSVSSSGIRENLNKEMLPEEIFEYIIRKGLYNGTKDRGV